MGRWPAVFYLYGFIVIAFGLMMLVPIVASVIAEDGALAAYQRAMLVTLAVGALLVAVSYRGRDELRVRDGFLLVALTWGGLPVFGALPLHFHLPGLSWTDAYFEATSGLTATGATLLAGLDALPVSINLWRTFMHWVGGMGVLVLAVAILPLLGFGGRALFKAEVPGPMKDARLTPRIAETARGLWTIYVLLTIACVAALRWAGMDAWDALIHAFSIMGLGGFSSKDASLGHFHSVPIELIAMGFALLSAINWATHFMALRSRSLVPYRRDAEIGYFLGVLTISILALSLYIWKAGVYADFMVALRYVAFHSISLATSLGFSTTDYGAWPFFPQIWMLFLGSFIACSGSTGGGIKMMRALLLYKQVYRELLRAMHPRAIQPVRYGGAAVSESVLEAVLGFMFIYVVSIVSLTLLLSSTGLEIVTAFSAIVACINNTGPGLNLVGPATNYAVLSDFQTWVCSFAMLLGRLEIFSLLVVLTPAFWRR
jgi:trk system potassium uptake protein TrkH